jgi:hypothetical protein
VPRSHAKNDRRSRRAPKHAAKTFTPSQTKYIVGQHGNNFGAKNFFATVIINSRSLPFTS